MLAASESSDRPTNRSRLHRVSDAVDQWRNLPWKRYKESREIPSDGLCWFAEDRQPARVPTLLKRHQLPNCLSQTRDGTVLHSALPSLSLLYGGLILRKQSMTKGKRRARRFALYLSSIGIQPVLSTTSYQQWAADLQTQYNTLKVGLRQLARRSDRCLVRESGSVELATASLPIPIFLQTQAANSQQAALSKPIQRRTVQIHLQTLVCADATLSLLPNGEWLSKTFLAHPRMGRRGLGETAQVAITHGESDPICGCTGIAIQPHLHEAWHRAPPRSGCYHLSDRWSSRTNRSCRASADTVAGLARASFTITFVVSQMQSGQTQFILRKPREAFVAQPRTLIATIWNIYRQSSKRNGDRTVSSHGVAQPAALQVPPIN